MELLWFLLIGLAMGWFAGRVKIGGGFGALGDLLVGVIGALLGGLFFRLLAPDPWGELSGSLVGAAIGAIVLLLLLRLIRKA